MAMWALDLPCPHEGYRNVGLEANPACTYGKNTAVEIAMLRGSNVRVRLLIGVVVAGVSLFRLLAASNRTVREYASALRLTERLVLPLLVLSTSDLVTVRLGHAKVRIQPWYATL